MTWKLVYQWDYLGIHEGVDFQHTGSIREVHNEAISSILNAGHLVILPPLGYSLTGDVFNVTVTEVATECAIALKADKLAFFVDELPIDELGQALRQANTDFIQQMLNTLSLSAPPTGDAEISDSLSGVLKHSIRACHHGVERVHLLKGGDPAALLRELFSRDGSGTLITIDRWEHIRQATIADVGGIIELIAPLQESGTLVSRSREELQLDIENFVVSERDGTVVACAAMHVEVESSTVEISCIATHPEYRGEGRADQMLTHLERRARELKCTSARILSTHTGHWFIARGYLEIPLENLPTVRRASYNELRNSKIYCKDLEKP